MVTRAGFEVLVGEGGGSIPVAYAFLYLDVILHGLVSRPLVCIVVGVRLCLLACMHWSRRPLACMEAGVR